MTAVQKQAPSDIVLAELAEEQRRRFYYQERLAELERSLAAEVRTREEQIRRQAQQDVESVISHVEADMAEIKEEHFRMAGMYDAEVKKAIRTIMQNIDLFHQEIDLVAANGTDVDTLTVLTSLAEYTKAMSVGSNGNDSPPAVETITFVGSLFERKQFVLLLGNWLFTKK